MSTDGLLRPEITDGMLDLMRNRAGYSNPTIRSGRRQPSWWTVTTPDAIRHFVNGYGDDNPLYCDPQYGLTTRWAGQIAPPGFVAEGGPLALSNRPILPEGDSDEVSPGEEPDAWLRRLGRRIPDELHARTKGALRGVHLYASGVDTFFYRPLYIGDYFEGTAGGVYSVEPKESEFAGRSAVVKNQVVAWNQRGEIVSLSKNWFVHASRKKVGDGSKLASDHAAFYTDEELAGIDAAYEEEFRRGADPLFWEDAEIGQPLPRMVKGPMVITDLISHYMGWGWGPYGNGALRLSYENRKHMRSFYSKNEYNSWDTIQRLHWEAALAREVGIPLIYDIGPMRHAWAVQYCTNFMGDEGWLYHLQTEWRKFNYFGDTTWWSGTIKDKYLVDGRFPAVDLEFVGTNQRGVINASNLATVLLPSRAYGPVKLPAPPVELVDKVAQLQVERSRAQRAQSGVS
jgi:hypothetical protein